MASSSYVSEKSTRDVVIDVVTWDVNYLSFNWLIFPQYWNHSQSVLPIFVNIVPDFIRSSVRVLNNGRLKLASEIFIINESWSYSKAEVNGLSFLSVSLWLIFRHCLFLLLYRYVNFSCSCHQLIGGLRSSKCHALFFSPCIMYFVLIFWCMFSEAEKYSVVESSA